MAVSVTLKIAHEGFMHMTGPLQTRNLWKFFELSQMSQKSRMVQIQGVKGEGVLDALYGDGVSTLRIFVLTGMVSLRLH
jgi:hypothetical protein